jgi:hypothetical protein
MSGFLRFVRIVNAAIWCGASVFLVMGLPGLFSPELERLLSKPYVGFAAEALFQRYFLLYYCCAAVALLCAAAEWVYSARGSTVEVWLLGGLTVFGVAFGVVLQPRMHVWHYLEYFGRTAEQRAAAARLFGIWHGISQLLNLFVIAGLVFYLWRSSRPPELPRFGGFSKMRG